MLCFDVCLISLKYGDSRLGIAYATIFNVFSSLQFFTILYVPSIFSCIHLLYILSEGIPVSREEVKRVAAKFSVSGGGIRYRDFVRWELTVKLALLYPETQYYLITTGKKFSCVIIESISNVFMKIYLLAIVVLFIATHLFDRVHIFNRFNFIFLCY